jgi:hypothetical protein
VAIQLALAVSRHGDPEAAHREDLPEPAAGALGPACGWLAWGGHFNFDYSKIWI